MGLQGGAGSRHARRSRALLVHGPPISSQQAMGKPVARVVVEYEPSRVVEFGANAGRNLAAIRRTLPSAHLIGLDINKGAVAAGRERWGLDLRVGDVAALSGLKADLAFTVSVLDHLPEPSFALAALADVAPTVLLIEP